jgi:alpha-tubulin suppressor-like RCC1 family protein
MGGIYYGAFSWGTDTDGELGNYNSGTSYAANYPQLLNPPVRYPYASIAAGQNFSLAVDRGGNLAGWGLNSLHQVGQTGAGPYTSPTPIGTSTIWKSVAAGWTHGCAIDGAGSLWCWGDNALDETSYNGGGTQSSPAEETQVSGPWLEVSAGNEFTFSLLADGTIHTWGSNVYGQLGTDNQDCGTGGTNHTHYVRAIYGVSGAPSHWVAVSAGQNHALAIGDDGSLWAWGDNPYGQLGCGSSCGTSSCTSPTVCRNVPVKGAYSSGSEFVAPRADAPRCQARRRAPSRSSPRVRRRVAPQGSCRPCRPRSGSAS